MAASLCLSQLHEVCLVKGGQVYSGLVWWVACVVLPAGAEWPAGLRGVLAELFAAA